MFEITNLQILGDRENQQDYFATYSLDFGELIVLADGMGGENGGEIASRLVVKKILSYLENCEDEIEFCFKNALNEANIVLENEISKNNELDGMGTTLIVVFITNDSITWLSVGDSPLYQIRDTKIIRLNDNHSIGGELDQKVEMGIISKDEAINNPKRHYLTSAVSGYEIEQIDFNIIATAKGDIYIIASDGIQSLSDKELLKISLENNTLDKKATKIIDFIEAYKKPHQDNTTLIMVKEK